jgi:superfamily II DNA/RNA helicase
VLGTSCSYVAVHRIGRTGRYKRKGLATTFINRAVDLSVLLDLKALLEEAKQEVPIFLQTLQSESDKILDIGGNFKLSNRSKFVTLLSIFCRRQGLFILRWTWSSHCRLSETRVDAQ